MSGLTLDALRTMVHADIVSYAAATRASAAQFARPAETNFFLDQLLADQYCVQGLLVLIGYLLCARPGLAADEQPAAIPLPIIVAARAVQMTHMYAEQVFGASTLAAKPASQQPAAHTQTLEQSRSLSLHAGLHAAEILLANLDVPAELRLKAVSITNRALLVRTHGQAAQYARHELAEAEQNMLATELALNPLHVGMVLADADCAATDAITPFALELGRAMLAPEIAPKISTHWLDEARKSSAWNRHALNVLEQLAKSVESGQMPASAK